MSEESYIEGLTYRSHIHGNWFLRESLSVLGKQWTSEWVVSVEEKRMEGVLEKFLQASQSSGVGFRAFQVYGLELLFLFFWGAVLASHL